MSYKQIHETFWTDPEVKKYPKMYRWLFAYFISGPHAHYSGLYYLPLVYIQNETGCTQKEITDGMKFLSDKGHVFYDQAREVIFVKSEMIYQLDNKRDGQAVLNEKQIIGLKKHFDTLHRSPLIAKFLEIYPYLHIEYTGIDTRIDTGMDRDSVPVPVPVTVQEKKGGASEKQTYGEFVELTDDEHTKLKEKFNGKLESVIEFFNTKIGSKGIKAWRKDHASDYYTILNWDRQGWIDSGKKEKDEWTI